MYGKGYFAFGAAIFASELKLVEAGARFGKTTCPESISAQADFDLESYAGSWYEIVRDRTTPFELLAGCVVADYAALEDGETIGVTNSGHRYNKGWDVAQGKATPAGGEFQDTGSLIVQFEGMPDAVVSDEPNYIVLDTDYDSYSIVYSCGNLLGLFTIEYLWVLAREPTLDQATM